MSLIWSLYSIAVLTIAGCATRDWRDPEKSRAGTLLAAAVFAVLFVIVGVLIVVLK